MPTMPTKPTMPTMTAMRVITGVVVGRVRVTTGVVL
jgi:hypothetical protein